MRTLRSQRRIPLVRFNNSKAEDVEADLEEAESIRTDQYIKDAIFRIENSAAFDKVSINSKSKDDSSPWNGEENIKDATLRMLIDSTPPLRSPGHKKQIQQPVVTVPHWEKQKQKPQPTGEKIIKVKDKVFDYQSKGKTSDRKTTDRPRPVSMAGYRSLIEERIENARNQGHFTRLEGRGKPFGYDVHDSNPFLDRSERLMNRIVKRQGAAPPWVEAQQDVEMEQMRFRSQLREDWLRHALRTLSSGRITQHSVDTVHQWRDYDWQRNQEGFHVAYIKQINNKIRSYNIMAPHTVRRGYLLVDKELEMAYSAAVDELRAELQLRLDEGNVNVSATLSNAPDLDTVDTSQWGFGDWWRSVKRRWASPV